MKSDTKFEEELGCYFKTDIGSLKKFDPSTWKSKKYITSELKKV